MAYNLDNRQIRIFISSTFKDMQDERNYLITKVFPLLQAEAEKRDVIVTPLDLRWGITEEQAENGEVLQVCLEEIENCHPYFIGIIGNYYGSKLSKDVLQKNKYLVGRWGDWIEKDIENELSITEMEMQYGVLRSIHDPRAVFFFKENNDEDDREATEEDKRKLNQLKEKIRSDKRVPVVSYRDVEELGELVKDAFLKELNELYPNRNLSPLEKERIIQSAFLHANTEVYVPKEENFEVIDYFINDLEQHNLVITGESGIGKSALIANWVWRHIEDDSRNIIYHFLGSHNTQCNYRQIVLRLSDEISDIYDLQTSAIRENKKPEEILQANINAIDGMKPLIIVLDGINLIADENGAKLLNWLPYAPKNVKFLFSTLDNDITMETFCNRKYPVYTLGPLDYEQKKELIKKYLQKYSKSLTDEQANRIINAPICSNALILKALLDELVSYGCYEKLNERIDYYSTSDSIGSFFQKVLIRYEQDFITDIVRIVLGLIAVSNNGLSENEIRGMIGLDTLRWSQFYCAIRHHLTIKNGLYTFRHHYIRDAVISHYADFLQFIRWEIIRYFKESRSTRAYDELPYQYYMLEKKAPLLDCIIDFEVADYLLKNSYSLFGQYWGMVLASDKHPQNKFYYYLIRCGESNYSNATLIANIGLFFDNYFGVAEVSLEYSYKALEIIKSGKDTSSAEVASVYGNIGATLTESGDVSRFSDAEVCFKLAICQQQLKFGQESIEVAKQYYNLGSLYNRWDKVEKAKEYLLLTCRIYEKTLGPNNIHFASLFVQLGSVFNQLGEHSKAIDYLLKAKDIYYSYNLTAIEQVADVYFNLAGVYSVRGIKYENTYDINFAIDYCKKAIEISKARPIHSKDLANYYTSLGDLYCHVNKHNEALSYLLEAIEIYKKTVGEDARELYDAYFCLGKLYRETGKIKEANAYLLLCSVYYEDTFGEDHINAAIVNAFYGYTLYDAGKKLLARKFMLKALKVYEKEYGMKDERTRSLSADIYYITKELGMI